MRAGTDDDRQLQLFTILHIKKQSVHYRILRSYKDTLHGPSDRIRTCGILLPKQARYQLRYTRITDVLYRKIREKAIENFLERGRGLDRITGAW